MYKIVMYDSTKHDFDEISEFCKSNYGISYSTKVKEEIQLKINSLKNFPKVNPIYLKSNNIIFRKRIVNKRYLIIFTILSNLVFIYFIFDVRRNIKSKDLFKL